jgi:hypothetical protein
MCDSLIFEHVPKRRCAPLERWRIPMRAANLLRGGTPYPFKSCRWQELGVWGEVAAHSPTLGMFSLQVVRPSSPSGAPSSSPIFTLCYISKHPPIAKLVGAGKGLLSYCNCTIILYWNKERLWRQTWCGSHVWMLIVMYQSMR